MGFSETQEMNPRWEIQEGRKRRMEERETERESSRAKREAKKRTTEPGWGGKLSLYPFFLGPLLDDQRADSQAPWRTSSSSNESQSQLNTPLCFTAPTEGSATMKKPAACNLNKQEKHTGLNEVLFSPMMVLHLWGRFFHSVGFQPKLLTHNLAFTIQAHTAKTKKSYQVF